MTDEKERFKRLAENRKAFMIIYRRNL